LHFSLQLHLGNHDVQLVAPSEQVAARTLGLAALVCRASLEDPSALEDARSMHDLVLRWVYDVGAEKGLSADELRILEAPPGELTREEVAWRPGGWST
jgi:hypothetical protein